MHYIAVQTINFFQTLPMNLSESQSNGDHLDFLKFFKINFF